MKSKLRIEEWYRYWSGKVYVSFSGGKDSTVLLHLVRSMYPDVVAVFADTGLEYPEIREFVSTIDNVRWIRPKMAFNKVIERYGYPVISKEQSLYIHEVRHCKNKNGKSYNIRMSGNKWGMGKISDKWKYLINAPFEISNKCCKVMKKDPISEYEKETGNKGFTGIMASEGNNTTTQYLINGCNAFETKRPLSSPLGFWLENDIWEYLKTYKVPYSKIYDMGYDRTGCMFCMYGVHLEKGTENRFQRMQKTHPKQFDYCMHKLGLKEVLTYIGVQYESQITIDDLLKNTSS
jgi:3'-phosphoadenosine 5'-phosphosulfate sulfotransferase (PAPS reductase)/FAD synthetase